MNRVFFRLILGALLALPALAQPPAADSLAESFLHPPDTAKPLIIWQWMNGIVSREGITADLEAFKRIGLSEGKPRPSQGRHTVVSFKFFTKDSPLLPSGLLRPVKLEGTHFGKPALVP